DIFLFSSLTETFGNVVLEAMASGLGVVTFDYAVGHLHISHKTNGMLASFNHSKDFRLGALKLFDDAALLESVRKNARAYTERQSWESITGQFEALLRAHSSFSTKKQALNAFSEVEYEN
ncbi:MAG: glycosyltransferase, partial [Gammaproteobacteria bacterium]|nr:glycosyltransferase [Gammaproteobacteria bacterium]